MKTLKDTFIGTVFAIAGFFLIFLITSLRVMLSPDVAWFFGGNTYSYPAILCVFAAIVGIPGAVGGAIISRLWNSTENLTFGFVGIAIGGAAHAAEMLLNILPYNLFGTIVMLALPIIGAVVGMMITDRNLIKILWPIIATVVLLLYISGALTGIFGAINEFTTGHRYIFYPILSAVITMYSTIRKAGGWDDLMRKNHPIQGLVAAGVIGGISGLIIARILAVIFH